MPVKLKILALIITVSSCLVPLLISKQIYAQGAPTRIELRVMQTRKFIKPPEQVVKAIIELYKDNGVSCFDGRRFGVELIDVQGPFQGKTVIGEQAKITYRVKGIKILEPRNLICGASTFEISVPEMIDKSGKGFEITMDEFHKANLPGNLPKLVEQGPTIVRARLKDKKNPTVQNFDPQAYQLIFKEIADGLFIDAIEINPATMQ
jgi:hypothetical protein